MILILSLVFCSCLLLTNGDFWTPRNPLDVLAMQFDPPFCPSMRSHFPGIKWNEEKSKVHYTNIADTAHGLDYILGRAPQYATIEAIEQAEFLLREDHGTMPNLRNHPGISIFDFDNDCDLDIYVSNTKGEPNSLFMNNLNPTYCLKNGQTAGYDAHSNSESSKVGTAATAVKFTDVAITLGVNLTSQYSAGSCFGDIDNDGDHDLIVLGRGGDPSYFCLNNNGSFAGCTVFESAGLANEACAFGDINNDGYLDLFIGTGGEFNPVQPHLFNPDVEIVRSLQDVNSLWLNDKNGGFIDISNSSGIRNVILDKGGCYPDEFNNFTTITHHVAIIDVNRDGCMDIVHGDESVMNPFIPRGNFHIWINDCAGGGAEEDGTLVTFTDLPMEERGGGFPADNGAYMGAAWGDLNCDGTLDVFATDAGPYVVSVVMNTINYPPYVIGPIEANMASQWALGFGNGKFFNPFPETPSAQWSNPFGWGTAIFDYDNDGDLDILSHGGLQTNHVTWLDNPGYIWSNQGCDSGDVFANAYKGPEFKVDRGIYDSDLTCVDSQGELISSFCNEHMRRETRGVAIGDLNNDGKMDIISTSVSTYPLADFPVLERPFITFGDPIFDDVAVWIESWDSGYNATHMKFKGKSFGPGDLFVEIDDGSNNNNHVKFEVKGSKDVLTNGKVNRDGIGTILDFYPSGMHPVTQTITGGDSHIAANALQRIFGMGQAQSGNLEIQFPGNIWNFFCDVEHNQYYLIYEVPCSFKGTWASVTEYSNCVIPAVQALLNQQLIEQSVADKMRDCNILAYIAANA